MKKIFIASDHAGVDLKAYLQEHTPNVVWEDLGPNTLDSVDYPDYADRLCKKIIENPNTIGVLVCGSGIGMSIRANKYLKIRASLCLTEEMAHLARQHNNANVLCLGTRLTEKNKALDILKAFMATSFEGGRHQRRVDKISVPT